ncbi:MAG TPA: glycosyltransferase [Rhodocyclaceae bacterium]|nr:glycosyltransferase [Rhodocyclaceae bacterium]
MSTATDIAVSVVVPTYRRPDLLQRLLQALLRQDMPFESYEIVVADDGPDPITASRVRAIARQHHAPRIIYLAVTNSQGPAGARNCGWRAAHGRIVAFTDDDTIPAQDWLRRGVEALSDNADAAAGKVDVPLPARPTDWERETGGLSKAEFVTANCFVTRNALLAVGGFDERYTMAWREDSDLQFALLQSGYKIVAAPQAIVTHPVRPAPWGISLRQQCKVFFDVLLYRKHPHLYRTRIRPVPPWHYYVIVLAIVIAPVSALAGSLTIFLTAAFVWLVLTARFCLRRLRGTSHSVAHIAEMVVTSVAIPPLALYWRLKGALHFRVVFL